jgi:adenine phosphoribosyltransferase
LGSLANHLAKPLLLARKPNKLPLVTHSQSYGLEYGQDALEIQGGLIPQQSSILLIDDVIATGGTMLAAIALMSQVGAKISGALSLIEIEGLGGNSQLIERGIPAHSILSV